MKHKIRRSWSWTMNQRIWVLVCPWAYRNPVRWGMTHAEVVNKGCPHCGDGGE